MDLMCVLLGHEPYLRLNIHKACLILCLYRADRLYAGSILVVLVLPMLYEAKHIGEISYYKPLRFT